MPVPAWRPPWAHAVCSARRFGCAGPECQSEPAEWRPDRGLRVAVGEANLVLDPDVTASYRRDTMPTAPAGSPLAVVFPTDTAQVAAVVRACAGAGVPIVPRGAGSGLTGAANSVDSGDSVVITKMNRILETDEGNRPAVVRPGLVNLTVRAEVESRPVLCA